jgi:hypothetical protein
MKTVGELVKISGDVKDTLLAIGLTKAELIMVTAMLQARINTVVQGTPVVAPVTEDIPQIRGGEEPVKSKKEIQYDPMYDPEPPMAIETPPARTTDGNKLLATKGHACVCNACTKVAYVVNRDIKDGMKVSEFIASFSPMDGVKPLTNKIEIQNIDGQISTDCPVCGANKTLYLTGRVII